MTDSNVDSTFKYLLTMYRFGDIIDPAAHHYHLGVFDTREDALAQGEIEKSWRGCKYEPKITKLPLNPITDTMKVEYHEQTSS